MYSVVKGVAVYFPTTIISGRSRDKVRELLGLEELYYAGSHRLDTMFPVQETSTNDCSSYIRSTKLGYYSLKRKYSGVRFTVVLAQNSGSEVAAETAAALAAASIVFKKDDSSYSC
nr:probable trehalose-phosphate phosphatase F isoform X1 [Tanacetum cinerariifolium]